MSIKISAHAIDRYCQRIDSRASYKSAKKTLSDAMLTSTREKTKTFAGDAIYSCSAFRMIVAEENGYREVVTVIPPLNDESQDDLPELAAQLATEFEMWEATHSHSSRQDELAALRLALARRQKTIALLQSRLEAKPKVKKDNKTDKVVSLEKKLEKQITHAKRMVDERDNCNKCIKRITKYLLEGDIERALQEIESTSPRLVDFLKSSQDGERTSE